MRFLRRAAFSQESAGKNLTQVGRRTSYLSVGGRLVGRWEFRFVAGRFGSARASRRERSTAGTGRFCRVVWKVVNNELTSVKRRRRRRFHAAKFRSIGAKRFRVFNVVGAILSGEPGVNAVFNGENGVKNFQTGRLTSELGGGIVFTRRDEP